MTIPPPQTVFLPSHWHCVIYGGLGLLLAIVSYTIIDWGLLDEISWGLVAFFITYTCILFLFFGRQNSGRAVTSWRPNALARFRSYLTFLPITHIIKHSESKECLRGFIEHNNSQPDETELSYRISIQKDLVIDAILDEYVAPWHSKISTNTAFLHQCRNILKSICQKVGEKICQVDRNEIAKEAIQTVHLHWKEYCHATTKSNSTGENMIKSFKFVHPYLQDSVEVSQRWEKMICDLLESLVIPGLESTLICQFLSGILVKSFFLYYTDLICQPSWINSNLIILLSSNTVLAELAGGSSQNSSAPPTPLPDRSPKNNLPSPLATSGDVGGSSGFTPPKLLETSGEKDFEENHFIFEKKEIQELGAALREWDKIGDSPLNRASHQASPSPSTSVSSALSGVIPTTALPLLPSGTFLIDHSFTSKDLYFKEDASILRVSSNHNKSTQNNGNDYSIAMVYNESLAIKTKISGQEENHSTPLKATTPTHYYSFEEVSTKASHPMLDTGTLSVDGALESKKEKCGTHAHELKILKDSDSNMRNSRSPVYEEPEDFAASIAKLRSLLEQKESKKNLHVGMENVEISSACIALTPNSDGLGSDVVVEGEDAWQSLGLKSVHGDVNEEPGSSDSNEEPVPELGCYFLNISIPKVESYNDSGGQFDFYCIQYEGAYYEEKYDDQPQQLILRTTTVKRRFKEFLLLQSKLEEQSHLKPHLKGIKTPNRWLNLSFSKADAATTRKAMLEKYITQLCTNPVLGTSRQIMQFMAYGDEGFSFDPLDINHPKHLLSNKLDKLAKKFTSVINSLKDALPSFDSNPPSPHSETSDPTDSTFQFSSKQQIPDTEENSEKPPLPPSSLETAWFENLVSPMQAANDETLAPQAHDPVFSNVTVNVSDASPDGSIDDFGTYTSYPLAAALTQLLCDVLWLPNCRPHNASVSTFMSLSGKSLENYVQETIDVFLSDEASLGYLEWFVKSLKSEAESISDFQYDLSTEMDLKNCLQKRIPTWVRWMWGRNRLDVTIERITDFFQNPIINQDLVFSLSELLFTKITTIS